VRVEDVPPPECGDGDVLIDVDAGAVRGSDLKSLRHGNPRLEPPLTLGHEFTGRMAQQVVIPAGAVRNACYGL
jgi:L-iditol 2-dehydrogenase